VLAVFGLLCSSGASRAITFSPEIWSRTVSSPAIDFAGRVATAGNGEVVVAGHTLGNVAAAHQGGYEVFLRRFDSAGNTLWSLQFSEPGTESANGLHVDAAGDVVVASTVDFSTINPTTLAQDILLRKVGADGSLLWSKKVEVPGFEYATNLAVAGAGEMFVSSYDSALPAFQSVGSLRKFSTSGDLLWTRSQSTPSASVIGLGVGVDNDGNSLLVGQVLNGAQLVGSTSGGGAFVSKYDAEGTLAWTRQFGNQDSSAWDVAVDAANNLYITGRDGEFNSGYLKKLDASGSELWTILFGGDTRAYSLDLDTQGSLFVGGYVSNSHATYKKFYTDGSPQWTREFKFPSGYDPDVVGDGLGNVYVYNTVSSGNSFDTVLLKALSIPEPATPVLFGIVLGSSVAWGRRRFPAHAC
jgi:hypothetical protein